MLPELTQQYGYKEVMKLTPELSDIGKSVHKAFTSLNLWGITNPYAHSEQPGIRNARAFPQEYYLLLENGEYEVAIVIGDDILTSRSYTKAIKQSFEGGSITCYGLPLTHYLKKGRSGAYFDLTTLFPGEVADTFVTFTLAGCYFDHETKEVLVSVPLRYPTKEYPTSSLIGLRPTSEYDDERFTYLYLHEKVHQRLDKDPISGLSNIDSHCNQVCLGIIKDLNQRYPQDSFISESGFLSWVKWQQSMSNTYK
jgi:hypothetical protein